MNPFTVKKPKLQKNRTEFNATFPKIPRTFSVYPLYILMHMSSMQPRPQNPTLRHNLFSVCASVHNLSYPNESSPQRTLQMSGCCACVVIDGETECETIKNHYYDCVRCD